MKAVDGYSLQWPGSASCWKCDSSDAVGVGKDSARAVIDPLEAWPSIKAATRSSSIFTRSRTFEAVVCGGSFRRMGVGVLPAVL